MNALRRKPLVVALFLALLGLGQAHAMIGQFQRGYVPLLAPPVRVPFSWDMFSIPITRCDVQWDPPMPMGRGYRHFRELGTALEWDPVYNTTEGYVFAAFAGCRWKTQPTHVRLVCMTPEGRREHAFDCP
jgi:hypothetical protein